MIALCGFPEATKPKNTLSDAKRLIGRRFDDYAKIQDDAKHWPFAVIDEGGNNRIPFRPCQAIEATRLHRTTQIFPTIPTVHECRIQGNRAHLVGPPLLLPTKGPSRRMSGHKAKKQGAGDKKAKGGKKSSGGEGKTKGGKSRFHVDIFTDHCMENAYYICHNIQDALKFRGFPWPDAANKKKKGKKGK